MLYTDRVSPERYDSLAAGYEKEHAEIKAKLQELDSHTSYVAMREKCIREFIKNAKEFVEMPKLTPKLLRAFIKRIEVQEKRKSVQGLAVTILRYISRSYLTKELNLTEL